MKIPESKQDFKGEITIPIGLCFGTVLGLLVEPIDLVYGIAGGLLLGMLVPTLFGPSSIEKENKSGGSDT